MDPWAWTVHNICDCVWCFCRVHNHYKLFSAPVWKCIIWVCMPLKSHTHLWGLLHLYSLCQQVLAHSPPAVKKQLQLPTCHDSSILGVVGPPQMESYMLQTPTLHKGVVLYTLPCFCPCGLKNNPVSLGFIHTFIRNKGTWDSFVRLCSHYLCSVHTLGKCVYLTYP